MSLQILTIKLDGITVGDYLTWCRDPDPPTLDYGLRSIDWDQPAPGPSAAANAAGLRLSQGVQIHPLAVTGVPHGDRRSARQLDREGGELIAPAARQP